MIINFRCSETEKIFRRDRSRKLPQDIQQRAFAKSSTRLMPPCVSKTCAYRPQTVLNLSKEIESANGASASTINGEYASGGQARMLKMLKS